MKLPVFDGVQEALEQRKRKLERDKTTPVNPLPTGHARYSAYRVTARYPRYRAVIASLAVARKRGLLSTEIHLVGNLNLPEMMNYL